MRLPKVLTTSATQVGAPAESLDDFRYTGSAPAESLDDFRYTGSGQYRLDLDVGLQLLAVDQFADLVDKPGLVTQL